MAQKKSKAVSQNPEEFVSSIFKAKKIEQIISELATGLIFRVRKEMSCGTAENGKELITGEVSQIGIKS